MQSLRRIVCMRPTLTRTFGLIHVPVGPRDPDNVYRRPAVPLPNAPVCHQQHPHTPTHTSLHTPNYAFSSFYIDIFILLMNARVNGPFYYH